MPYKTIGKPASEIFIKFTREDLPLRYKQSKEFPNKQLLLSHTLEIHPNQDILKTNEPWIFKLKGEEDDWW